MVKHPPTPDLCPCHVRVRDKRPFELTELTLKFWGFLLVSLCAVLVSRVAGGFSAFELTLENHCHGLVGLGAGKLIFHTL